MCGGTTAKRANATIGATQAEQVRRLLTDGTSSYGRTAYNLAFNVKAPTPSIRRAIGTLRQRGVNVVQRNGYYRVV